MLPRLCDDGQGYIGRKRPTLFVRSVVALRRVRVRRPSTMRHLGSGGRTVRAISVAGAGVNVCPPIAIESLSGIQLCRFWSDQQCLYENPLEEHGQDESISLSFFIGSSHVRPGSHSNPVMNWPESPHFWLGSTARSPVTSHNSLGLASVALASLVPDFAAVQLKQLDTGWRKALLFQKYQLAAIFCCYHEDMGTSTNM
jgi:hypothetical protein